MSLFKKGMFMVLILFLLDRFLKDLILFAGGPFPPDAILSLALSKNHNIAFSLPLGGTYLLFLIAIILVLLLVLAIHLYRNRRSEEAFFSVMIFLGAASNFYDRLKYGYVIDYIDLKYFTVFNISDCLIVLGAAGLGWMLIKGVDKP